jgi:hypothetical protein
VAADRAGLGVVLHSHDEIVVEAAASAGEAVLRQLRGIMCTLPAWARDLGLPINASGDVGVRYRK